MPGTIRLVDPQGETRDVPVEAAAAALDQGWRTPNTSDDLARVGAQASEADYGGVGGAIKAGVAGAARGVTLGLSDVAARALGGEDTALELEGLRAENPGISIGSEIAGGLGAAIATGGATGATGLGRLAAATPAGAIAKVGAGVAELGAGAGIAGKLGYAAAGGAIEGAVQGLGQGASELALSQDPLTLEHAVATLSSNMLFGAGFGGVVGAGAKGAELGMARAKGAIDTALARKTVIDESPDIAALVERQDRRGLEAMRKAEIDALDAARQPEREAFVEALDAHRSAGVAEKAWELTKGSPNRFIRGAGKESLEADIRVQNLLKNKAGLAEKPQRALDALQRQAQAQAIMVDIAERELAELQRAFKAGPDVVRTEIVAGRVAGENGPWGASGLDYAVEREMARRFGGGASVADWSGELVMPQRLQNALDVLPQAQLRNAALRTEIARLIADPVSDRLTQIASAADVLASPKEKSLGEHIIGAALPMSGPMGAIASASGRAMGGLRKAAAAATRRVGEATSSFLGAASKAAPYAPVVSTKVLSSVRYAPGGTREDETAPKGRSHLASAYKARTDEIKSQTAYDEMGVPRMRPEARAAVADRLHPVRAADPILADRLETLAARRIEYLSSLIPRRPEIAGVQIGPDHWQPSDLEMRTFARAASAVEDPYGVLDRAAHGAVTPEDAAAMRAVHPEILAEYTAQVSAELPSLQRSLPYARRISLSILTGVPVDPSMDPAIMGVLQAQYQYEPEPPRPQAQFGSVKSQEPGTPAQRREQGTTA